MSNQDALSHTERPLPPFGSNAVRLSGRHWIIAAAVTLAVFVLTPIVWQGIEKFEPDADYRIPYALSNDYWHFSRWCRLASARCKTLVIGDSVIWGQYVRKDQTLSHYLNVLAGANDFANLGVDGTHPAALAGLLEHYGQAISGKNVILHCNLLWTSSKRHDLQIRKEFRFNHPRLVPQFVPKIACYRESYSNRLGVVIERNVPFCAWTKHLRLAYFGGADIPRWTLEHPYSNPLEAVTLQLPSTDRRSRPQPIPWTERGLIKQSFPWVELAKSLQWRLFCRSIKILKRRGNRVFVLVGPFNEHMLDERSLDTYAKRKKEATAWLQKAGIPCCVPPPLPSHYYADASHPLSEGYSTLARLLLASDSFVRLTETSSDPTG